MNSFIDYIISEALIVIPMLWVIGRIIKNTPKSKDWVIPYILLIVGIVTTVALMGLSVDSIIQGVLVSGAAVFGNEIWKQTVERDG